MRAVAEGLDEALQIAYDKKMLFFLCVSPEEKREGDESGEGIADYISNAARAECIAWLRETADRLESGDVIPAGGGSA